MSGVVVIASLALLVGCQPEVPPECGPFEEVFVYVDADRDGYGSTAVGWTCSPAEDESSNNADCDDEDETVHPNAPELCDLLDNDCNGRADETLAKVPWFPDEDGDGFGLQSDSTIACAAPSPVHVIKGGDCDDDADDVSPGEVEVCNGRDDDCDGAADDADPGVDPSTRTYWYLDADSDGFGDPERFRLLCAAPAGAADNGDDCNDDRSDVNPGETEICNRRDDDCDTLVDDDDPNIDPASQDEYFADTDLDGYGDRDVVALACVPTNGASTNGDDCDDRNPIVTIPTDWYPDEDADGYGAGESLGFDCFQIGTDTAPGVFGLDCDDTDFGRSPGNDEICEDGVDNDCSGIDDRCGPIGSFNVHDGPNWVGNPQVLSCIQACAEIFGGVEDDYYCSTDEYDLNHMAFVSGWGDNSFCFPPGVAEDFSQGGAGGGYNCGFFGCAYSAYVEDNCAPAVGITSTNWCWTR